MFRFQEVRLAAFLVIVVAVASCSKEDSKWIDLGQTSDEHVYVDKRIAVPKEEPSYIEVHTLWNLHKPLTRPEGSNIRSIVSKLLIDCNRNMASEFDYVYYAEPMGTGSVIGSATRGRKEAADDFVEIKYPAVKAIADWACVATGRK